MVKKYIHTKTLQVPLYPCDFVIILSNDYKKIKRILPEYKQKYVHAEAWFDTIKDKWSGIVILNLEDKLSHGIISHEALHIINMVATHVKMSHDTDNDESMCYLISWVIDEVYKFIKENNLYDRII